MKFVSWKEKRAVASDLRLIYRATTEENGLIALEEFSKKWDKKYPHISKSWYKNWSELSVFYKYSPELRKLIYTTNPIESFNRSMRKVSKNRSVFPSEESVIKLFYLAIQDITKRWRVRIKNWGTIYPQLVVYFEDRLKPYL